jgi:hypothetical protein
MKLRYYFHILWWVLFNHRKVIVFWDWRSKGMHDLPAYKRAKEVKNDN